MKEKIEVDVLVVGAGTSGIPAAIAAARCGAKVLLIEENSVIGGTITCAYVAAPCGGPCTGIYKEMLDRLARYYRLPGGTNWFLPASWLSVMREMLRAEDNVRLLCGARNWRPIVSDAGGRPRIAGVALAGDDGAETIVKARATIDATGAGAVALAAGCGSMYGQEARSEFNEPHAPDQAGPAVQHCTWMYISQRTAPGPAFDMTRLRHAKLGVLALGLGWFHRKPEEAMARNTGIYLHWGCAVQCRDTRDPAAVAAAQDEALEAMEPDMRLLRENGFAAHLAPQLGIRESRRIRGDCVITENDLRSGALPDDTIAVGTYGLDLWGGNVSQEESHVPGYGIPYRALLPAGLDGLLLAGKSISGTHIAASAYRVQPILAAAAQAAGVAAALAAQSGATPRALDAQDVRRAVSDPGQDVRLRVPGT